MTIRQAKKYIKQFLQQTLKGVFVDNNAELTVDNVVDAYYFGPLNKRLQNIVFCIDCVTTIQNNVFYFNNEMDVAGKVYKVLVHYVQYKNKVKVKSVKIIK